MLYWQFHFENEIPVNFLFTQWNWTHMYWILDLENEVHAIWVIWISNLQECKGNFIFWSRVEHAAIFGWDMKIVDLFGRLGLPKGARARAPTPIHFPLKVRRGRSSVWQTLVGLFIASTISINYYNPLPPLKQMTITWKWRVSSLMLASSKHRHSYLSNFCPYKIYLHHQVS